MLGLLPLRVDGDDANIKIYSGHEMATYSSPCGLGAIIIRNTVIFDIGMI